jgi:hypothetical protein
MARRRTPGEGGAQVRPDLLHAQPAAVPRQGARFLLRPYRPLRRVKPDCYVFANRISKTRRTEYRNWVKAIYKIADDPRALGEFNQATGELFLFASDEVIRSVGQFKEYAAITNSPDGRRRDMREFGRLSANAILAMRIDSFEKTTLTIAEIRSLLPIQGVNDKDPND